MNGDLDDLRKRIDLLDESLVRLLNARAACALEIGRVKRDMGVPIYQPERENEVLRNVQAVNNGGEREWRGENAARHVRESYSWDGLSVRFADLYERVAAPVR